MNRLLTWALKRMTKAELIDLVNELYDMAERVEMGPLTDGELEMFVPGATTPYGVQRLINDLKTCREALRKYADPKSYEGETFVNSDVWSEWILPARQALGMEDA